MKACRPFRELLSAALDGPLAPEARVRLEGHLEGCAACRAYARDLEAVRAAVRGVEEVEPPVGFATRVMAHVRAEAAPRPTFWQRLRPILLKPQFQVATLLLVGVTSALLIRSRSGLGDAEVLRQMKPPAPADQERVPSAPAAAAPASPAELPRMRSLEEPESKRKADEAAGQGKAKDAREAEGFASPPPARPAETGAAPPPPPAPAQPTAPAPQALPETRAFGWTDSLKAAKPAAGSGPGAANTAATGSRTERGEPARDAARGRLDDAPAKSKKAGAPAPAPAPAAEAAPALAKEQAGKSVEKQEEDGVPAVLLQWEPEEPGRAAELAAREIEALGGTVVREGRRQQQAPRSLTGRLPAHQLPQLQARLARHGAVKSGTGQQQQAPRSGSVVILIRW